LNPKNHIYYANRAGVYVETSNYENAIEDSNRAIDIEPSYAKVSSNTIPNI